MAIGTGAALALGGATVLSAGAQIYAGNQAADAQRSAARSSNALQRYMYDTNRADQAPWRQTGVDALGRLNRASGPNADFSEFFNSPDYQFALQQGTQALDRSAASRGRLFSGAQMKEAQGFGQRLATQQFGNWWNRQAGLAGIGQSATNQWGQAGQNYANSAGQNMLYAGNAQASSYMNRGNALGGLGMDLAYGYGRGLFGGGSGSGGGGSQWNVGGNDWSFLPSGSGTT